MKKRWLSLLLTLCMLVIFAPAAMANDETQDIYVRADGSDVDGMGTPESPYQTLNHAIESVLPNESATIYVMSDMTVSESTRFWEAKDITIKSDPKSLTSEKKAFTISRGTDVEAVDPTIDPARGGYNGAMIEVGNGANLTLTNIILDDKGYAAYTEDSSTGTSTGQPYFTQVDASRSTGSDPGPGSTTVDGIEVSNHKIVQDAIIASYDTTSKITLGGGAILQNFGGMSAVRVTAGSQLIMEAGSKICDTTVTDRTKGAGGTGPAGAVWIQGGSSFILEKNASIENVVGRAVYADGADITFTINGTISGIVGDGDMWQGQNGTAFHIRNYAVAELNGTITDMQGSGSSAVYVVAHGEFTMNEYSSMNNFGTGVKGIQLYGDQGGEVTVNGEITGIKNDNAININSNKDANNPITNPEENALRFTIGPDGYIHHNSVTNGAIYMQTDSGTLDIHGKINYNIDENQGDSPGGVWLCHNQRKATVTMYPGAQICNNSAQKCGGIMVSQCEFTMIGGTISGNIARNATSGYAGGLLVRNGGTFVMEGGEIKDNFSAGVGGGVGFISNSWGNNPVNNSCAELVGGTISGNMMKATISGNATDGYTATGGEANDLTVVKDDSSNANISRYLTIGENVTLDEESIYFAKYGFTMERPAAGVKIGNAATACETTVTDQLRQQNLTEVAGSFWYQFDDAIGSLTMTVPTTYDQSKKLYAAIIATDENGAPVANAGVSLRTVEVVNNSFTLSLPGSTNGYAVVLVQEDDPAGVISVVPADLTIYMGGNGGYDAVYDGSTSTNSNSLPHPIFKVTAPANVNLEDLTFTNGTNTWKLKEVSEESSETAYYRFVPQNESPEVRVQYSNGSTIVTDDEFDPSTIQELFEEYTISIYSGSISGSQVTASVSSGTKYLVATGTGTLTVRAVADENPTSEVVKKVPDNKLTSGTATAVKPDGTVYTLNNTGVTLPSDAKPSLLFDDIIEDAGSTARTDAIKAKVDEKVGAVGSNTTRHYEIKYLDLVDANNGNAWITSSEGMYIYWAYPEGTNQSTNFKLIHFPGLHRDGEESGFDVGDINNITPEKVTITNTETGIYFHVKKAGFSPFALVWDVTASTPVNPNPPADPDDTGVSDLLDTENHGQYLYGYPDNTFGPDLNMTRAEVAQMFYNLLLDKNVPITVTFEDVPENAWYEKAVNTLASLGIISGVGDNKFEPDRSITRAEFTAMAMKFAMGETGGENIFSDIKSTDWYYNAVVDSIKYGWINGYGDGTFRPNNPITRGEVTAIVNHMLGREADKQFVQNHSDELNAFSDITSKHWAYYHVAEATNTHRYVGENGSETWTSLE